MTNEHRRSARHPFTAEAEVTEIATSTQFAARTGDISLGGCYLDMLNPSPSGVEVRVKITHEGATFTADGRVAYSLPNTGMGIAFLRVEPADLDLLKKWIPG